MTLRSIVPVLVLGLAIALATGADAKTKKPDKPKAATGELTIFSATKGAKIYIDNKFIGEIPYSKPISLPVGQHSIKVTKRGYTDYLDTFEVKAGEETELEVDLIAFAGIVKVKANTPDAVVYLDDKVSGGLPYDKDVPVGKHKLVVKAPGYTEQAKDLEVMAGKEYAFEFTLEKIKGWVPPGTVVVEKTPWYKTWWFWTVVGVVVAGGTTTGIVLGTRGGGESLPTVDHVLDLSQ